MVIETDNIEKFVDDSGLVSSDHRDFINMKVFGPLNRMMSTEPSRIESKFEVCLPDGTKGIGSATVSFGLGQPQEPQFQLYSDLLDLWMEQIDDEDVDLLYEKNRRIIFKSLNSLLLLQQKSRGGKAVESLIKDIQVLHATSIQSDISHLDDLIYANKHEKGASATIIRDDQKGVHLIEDYHFENLKAELAEKNHGVRGYLTLSKHFCEMALSGKMITYNRNIYQNKKLGTGVGRKLYRVLNSLYADEIKMEAYCKSKGESYFAKSLFKFELKEFLYEVIGLSEKTVVKKAKSNLKTHFSILISFGILKSKDGFKANGEPYGVESCFMEDKKLLKNDTFVVLRLGDFFLESDRHKAEEMLPQTTFNERNLMGRLNILGVTGTQPLEFIELTHNKDKEVTFDKMRGDQKVSYTFFPNEFSYERLQLIVKWFELREKLKKQMKHVLPNGMIMHKGSGALVDTIKFDSFAWKAETEFMESYYEKLDNLKEAKPKIDDYLNNRNVEAKDEENVPLNDPNARIRKFLYSHRPTAIEMEEFHKQLIKIEKKESFRKTWFREESLISVDGQLKFVFGSPLGKDWIETKYMVRIKENGFLSRIQFGTFEELNFPSDSLSDDMVLDSEILTE